MLDAYIIDAIHRQERLEPEPQRIRLELPLERWPRSEEQRPTEGGSGPVVIPLSPEIPIRDAEEAA